MEQGELAARERVRGTIAAYTHAGDRFTIDLLAECFALDGVLEIRDGACVTGRGAIVDPLTGPAAVHQVGRPCPWDDTTSPTCCAPGSRPTTSARSPTSRC
jgi:hypothetical protein